MLSLKPNPTVQEDQRVSILRSLNIMDTPKERSFDLIAEGLVQLYAVPMALVNFMVRWLRMMFRSFRIHGWMPAQLHTLAGCGFIQANDPPATSG